MIREVPGLLTPEECAALSARIAVTRSDHFTDAGLFENKMWRDEALAADLYDRLCRSGAAPTGALRANNVVMAGVYQPGNAFGLHTDTGLHYDVAARTKTRWTLLVYLNDDFDGGATVFHDPASWAVSRRVTPQTGKALLFDIDLWHAGEVVRSGEKRWVGCEVIGAMPLEAVR